MPQEFGLLQSSSCVLKLNMSFTFIYLKSTSGLCSSIIVSVRETCADWHIGVEPQADPALKGKKDTDTGFGVPKVPRRNVGKYV